MKKILIVALLFTAFGCYTPVHIDIPAGDRDTLIINCDTIIWYKKFRLEEAP